MLTRLAPTPSGYLHPGNGASFVLTWALARASGSEILLRIDDMDMARRRDKYLDDIFRTIEWLGIDYDLGPTGPDDFLQNWSQEHRIDLYRQALKTLCESGKIYACNCSRKKRREMAVDHRYTGHCRHLEKDLNADRMAWRVQVPNATKVLIKGWCQADQQLDLSQLMGDFVVRSRSGAVAYQLSSVVDDLHYGVTAIVRGEDLLASTAAQLYLADLCREQSFQEILFWHHPLLLGEDGEKLSKSAGAGSLLLWRENGISPQAIYSQVAAWLGQQSQSSYDLKDLVYIAELYTKNHHLNK